MTGLPRFDRAELVALFDDLAYELSAHDQTAQMFVVGGAAMALAYDWGRTTHDVDAVYEPKREFRQIAEIVGNRHGLPPDWLNDAAKGFMPGGDPDAEVVYTSPSLMVMAASPRYLLAMKLFGAREAHDLGDAVTLFTRAGLTSADQALTLLEECYPPGLLEPKHRFFALEVAQQAVSSSNPGSNPGL